MSAKDISHNTVRSALAKYGWTITHDPLSIKVDEIEFYVDLGAERILAAQKHNSCDGSVRWLSPHMAASPLSLCKK